VEADEPGDPIAVTALGPDTIVSETQEIAHLLEEFFGLPETEGEFRLGDMKPAIKGGSPGSKRIRQILSAFKGRFLGPNTR
jgi:hypothetical protein